MSSPGLSTRSRLAELVDRRLSADEWASLESIPIGEAEREEVLSLVRWFTRRYPTPAERLAYVRRAHRRWLERVESPGSQ